MDKPFRFFDNCLILNLQWCKQKIYSHIKNKYMNKQEKIQIKKRITKPKEKNFGNFS
jgi:hypothetical protein